MTGQIKDQKNTDPPGAFWAWATASYARSGAADSLIAAQDTADLNVNIMLWACWTATRFESPPDAAIRRAMEAVDDWHLNVTRPLRATRRAAKRFVKNPDFTGAEAMRESIKGIEIAAERIEIDILDGLAFRLLTPIDGGDVIARARRNLAAYAGLAGAATRDGFSTTLLHRVIDHIFGERRAETMAGQERDPL